MRQTWALSLRQSKFASEEIIMGYRHAASVPAGKSLTHHPSERHNEWGQKDDFSFQQLPAPFVVLLKFIKFDIE